MLAGHAHLFCAVGRRRGRGAPVVLAGCSVVALIVTLTTFSFSAAQAAGCPTVTGNVTTTQTLAPGDNCIVNSGASINVSGPTTPGITGSAGHNISVANGGSINTNGTSSPAIDVGSNNTLTNNGIIITNGDSSKALDYSDDNTVYNNGDIYTYGNFSAAMGTTTSDDNIVVNNGRIFTHGTSSHGIWGDDDNTITNNGLIDTKGDFAHGVYVDDSGNAIVNNGRIVTSGAGADGINLDDHLNTVENYGSIISAQGWGIDADDDHIDIINHGLIQGNGIAIDFAFGNNSLTLNPGSVIIGLVSLGSNTTVNINTRLPSILSVDAIGSHTFNSTTHTLYVDNANNRVIAFSSDQLRTNSGGIYAQLTGDGVAGILFGGNTATTMITAAGAGDQRDAVLNAPRVSMLAGAFLNRTRSKEPRLWSTVFGGMMALRFHPTENLLVGLHAGAGRTKTEGGRGRNSWFGGVHAQYEEDGSRVALLFTAGRGGAGGGITFLDNTSPTGFRTFFLDGKATYLSGEAQVGTLLRLPGIPFLLKPELMARITWVNSRVALGGLPMLPAGGGKTTAFDGRAQITTVFDLESSVERQAQVLLTSGMALHDEQGEANDQLSFFKSVRLQVRMADDITFSVGGESHLSGEGFVGLSTSLALNMRF